MFRELCRYFGWFFFTAAAVNTEYVALRLLWYPVDPLSDIPVCAAIALLWYVWAKLK